MARRKKKPEPQKIARPCDCWLDIGRCYCEDNLTSIRYSVKDLKGQTHSRWETPNEALEDGRKHLGDEFEIYDNLEEKTLLKYGGE